MKHIYSFILALFFAFSSFAQTEYTIGSASGSNANTTYPCPVQDYFEGSRSQYLYLASELQAAGMTAGLINSIKFPISSLNSFSGVVEAYSISIGTTTTTSLSTSTWEPGTNVVYGPLDYTPFVGDNEFVFSSPFFWDGTSNIIIEICNGESSNLTATTWTGNPSSPWTTGLSFNGSHTYRADNIASGCGTNVTSNTGTTTTRPDVILVWAAALPCSGVPLAGNTTSSRDSVCVNQPFQISVANGFLGTGLTYQWESSINNGTSWQPINGATQFSYNVPSISITTCYRRKTTCSNGGAFSYSSTKCIVAKPFYECYCSPITGNVLYTTNGTLTPEINSVAIVGGTVNYTNAHTPTNTDPKGYALFTGDTALLEFRQGCQYTATIGTAGTLGSLAMWADWNKNNIFDSAEYSQVIIPAGNASGDVIIDVPTNAPLGTTMVRFRVVSGTQLNFNQACESFFNGEVEDYLVKVIPGTACTGTPLGGDTKASLDSACPSTSFLLTVDNATTCVTGLTYQWEMQSNCSGAWTPIVGATSKNYLAPSISTDMSYRRKITCGSNSSYSLPKCVYVKPFIECYCSPFTGNPLQGGTSPWINNVNLTGGTLSWDAAGSGITNENNTNGYSQYLDTLTAPNGLEQAKEYDITLTLSGSATQSTAFVDWNQNGQFEASERINLTPAGVGKITPPANALIGWTVMRLRIRAATFNTACEQNFSGETEDFIIKVLPGTQCSGTPIPGDAVSSADSVCKNSPFTLSVDNSTTGVIGISYQWYSSANGTTGWTPIANATGLTTTIGSISTDMCYRRGMKCNNGTEVFSTVKCITLKSQFECYCGPSTGFALHNPASAPFIDTVMIDGNGLSYFQENTVHPTVLHQYLDTSTAPELTQGNTYTFSVNLSSNPTQAAIFIDYDQSGTFDLPGEVQAITYPAGQSNSTVNITIPATAIPGVTLMRIRVRAANFTNACEEFGSGESFDQIIKIKAGAQCSGTPVGGTTNSTHSSVCRATNFNLSVSGASNPSGVLGFSYQWQENIAGIWTNIASATGTNYTSNLTTSDRTFRRKIKCSFSNDSSYSTPITIMLNTPIYASLPYSEGFENSWLDGCGINGSRSIPSNHFRNTPVTGDTSWRRMDDGASANWTNPTNGMYSPVASEGTKSARFHTSVINSTASASLDLHLNCTGGATFKRLTFDYINLDGSDSLSVLMSTDGGVSYTRLDSAGVRFNWARKTIDFASSAATTIIRFRAVSDAGTSDIGIDNIRVESLLPVDIQAMAVVAPVGSIGSTNNGTVQIRVRNNGGSIIDFSNSPMVFGADIKDANSNVVTLGNPVTINSDTLRIGSTRVITVSTTTNFSALGQYTIRVWAKAQNDGNAANDTTSLGTFIVNSPAKVAVASGFWGDGATWNNGTVPVSTDTVNITGFTVTLNGGAQPGPYTCNSLGIGSGGTLIGNSNELTIGAVGGGNKAFTIASGGTLNISNANINHNGFILFNSGANFIQTGGNLTVDGNDGTNLGSVQNGTDIFGIGLPNAPYATGNISLTGGKITIVDPHRFGTNSSAAFAYRGSVANNLGAGHTLTLGVPTSSHTSITNSNGFFIMLNPGGSRLSVGNIEVNGGNTVGNRFTVPSANIGLNGNLIINQNSEYRCAFQTFVAGNITNDGTYSSNNTLNLQTFLNGNAGSVPNTQTISGNGIYRNTLPNVAVSVGGSGYQVGDILTLGGGTFVTPARIYVSAVNGTGAITSSVLLNLGNYTVAPPLASTPATGGSGSGASFTSANVISTSNFAGLTINNTSSGGVTINSLGTPLAAQTGTVSGTSTLRMIDGIVNNNVTVTLGNSINQRGTLNYTAGLFTGKFARWYAAATNATTSGDFPVGKGNVARNARVEFTSAPTKGGVLTAEFIALPSTDAGFPLVDGTVTLTNAAQQGYWRIENDTITGGNYSISLTYTGLLSVSDLTKIRVVKRPTNGTNWTIDGLAGTNSGTTVNPVVARTGLSGFSEFTVAGDATQILPSTELLLTGEKATNFNHIKFIARNEVNVKLFEVQRSIDGRVFETINSINSKSTSTASTNTYSYFDINSVHNNVYYRIKEVSANGLIAYSNVIYLKGNKSSGLTISTIYPNPANNSIKVSVVSPKNNDLNIIITDVNGKIISLINKTAVSGDNLFVLDISKLASTTYFLTVKDKQNNSSNIVSFIKK